MAVRLLGETLRETVDYFMGVTAGRKPKPPPAGPEVDNDRLKIWARLVISALATGGGISMLLLGNAQAQQAGAGFIGLVLGYWLR